ncbi:hypothetical protein AAF712_014815 [Marasmius tenuissimus]|uniref:CxC1-like cysteine cluster associated with KDZ transposases domain-containing protein n=1 Tax=Marasmius tenuissimus TaxID=585030 RepID=A0ABR2ZB21_9AGAR
MDGNNSLKMVDIDKRPGRARLDTRKLHHPRWLDATTVDVFKDEVSNSHKCTPVRPAPEPEPSNDSCNGPEFDSEGVAWLNVNEIEGLEKCLDTCVERWKAAAPEGNKKMYSFFSISGIFVSVCRHRHVLVVCDMRRSGELMKYPLAVVKALLDRYGKDIGLGYDIMCAFYTTLLRSSQLGQCVVACRLKGVVPAFHGHAHSRKCQVSWHPMYTKGVGLEDFEECECTFSESNNLAATTRLSTEFHRHQSLMEHFDFHDIDKHMTSGNFIYQNYRQALQRIAADTPLFNNLCEQYGVTEDDCERFLREETNHFSREYQEPPELAARLDYVEMLQRLSQQKTLSDDAHAKYRDKSQRLARKQLISLQTRSRTALDRYKATLDTLLDFENDNNFFRRWEPLDDEYQQTLTAMRGRNYGRALDKLERLVMQRLLELTKLNMSGVGYKQREKISQALRARAKAIQTALDAYNEAARLMDPPRPTLQWKDILDMATVADFDLLRDTELDLTHVPWAQPGHRECVRLYFGLKRSHEEITRLNVEISRLITFMIDEHADYHHAVTRARDENRPDIALELEYRKEVSTEVNGHIVICLLQTSELDGFCGTLLPAREEEHLCLRLQNKAEQRWLILRGLKGRERVEVVRKRAIARAEIYGRYSRKLRRRQDLVNNLEKTIRLRERGIADHQPGDPWYRTEQAERLEKWKKDAEEDLKMEREEARSLEEMVRRFAPRTTAGISTRPRRLPLPSPELLAVVQQKIALVYPNGR